MKGVWTWSWNLFLNEMNVIQIEEEDYEMVENEDHVVSLGNKSACESI